MKRWQQILLQCLASAANVFQMWSPIIPDKYKLPIGLGIGSAQVVLGGLQASYNPDGTAATQAYIPPAKP